MRRRYDAVHHPCLLPGVSGLGRVSPVGGHQSVQARGRLGNDLCGFTSKLLVPGAAHVGQRLVQFMHGAAIVPSPGVVVVTALGVVTGPPGALELLGVTGGPPVALAAPHVLAIADTVA